MEALLRHPKVHTSAAHQCRYGLIVPAQGGGFKLAKKPTRFATSSAQIANRMSKLRTNDHVHQRLEGGEQPPLRSTLSR